MTREEAIRILEINKPVIKRASMSARKYIEAYEMAISALSAEPCREVDDYENEIADLHNRLDIAEYDKERYKEEITTLETKNKGEWIPVSERLPKAFETVLRTRVENGWNGTTYTIVDTGCICPAYHNIVAWMPLPSPWKGE